MDLQIPIQISTLSTPINYQDNIMLMGSCFTEHIGEKLDELKFSVLQNPNGILFDPASVVSSLVSYIQSRTNNTKPKSFSIIMKYGKAGNTTAGFQRPICRNVYAASMHHSGRRMLI
jgi:hypothetical protein